MSKDMEVCTGTSNMWLLDFKENNFAGENIACLKGSITEPASPASLIFFMVYYLLKSSSQAK